MTGIFDSSGEDKHEAIPLLNRETHSRFCLSL